MFWLTRRYRPSYCHICPIDDPKRREFVQLCHFRTMRQAGRYVAKLCREREASHVHER